VPGEVIVDSDYQMMSAIAPVAQRGFIIILKEWIKATVHTTA
jgi:hypothetical protein